MMKIPEGDIRDQAEMLGIILLEMNTSLSLRLEYSERDLFLALALVLPGVALAVRDMTLLGRVPDAETIAGMSAKAACGFFSEETKAQMAVVRAGMDEMLGDGS